MIPKNPLHFKLKAAEARVAELEKALATRTAQFQGAISDGHSAHDRADSAEARVAELERYVESIYREMA
jgi:hypothetical protein